MNFLPSLLAVLSPAAADVVYAGLSVAFFLGAFVFAWFCEKVR